MSRINLEPLLHVQGRMHCFRGLKTSHLLKSIDPSHRILLKQLMSQGHDEVEWRDFEEEPSQEEKEDSNLDEMKQAIHLLEEDSLAGKQCMYYYQTILYEGGILPEFLS